MQPRDAHEPDEAELPAANDAPTLPLRAHRPGDERLTPAEALAEGVRRAEAILFAAGEPLSAEQIAEVLPQGVEPAEVLMALKAIYARRGVNLIEVAGKWRFQTAQDLAFLFVETRQVQKRLSQAALETLAIIAYGQPVTRAEIEAVRGVGVAKTVIDQLMEIGWVKIRGRRKTPGQPLTYGTTPAFLEHFGLESLDTLPGKADLEAEGLLSDVLPPDWQMPDEEALDGDSDGAPVQADDTAESRFVTDYMSDAETSEAEPEPAVAEPETHILNSLDFDEDVIASRQEGSEFGLSDDIDDEDDSASGDALAGFSVPPAPVRSSEDDEEFDRAAMTEAVIKLSKRLKKPQASDWGNDGESE